MYVRMCGLQVDLFWNLNLLLTNQHSELDYLTETTSFTFRFQKAENIVFTNGTLDITNDGTVGIVHEFNADLGDTTTRTGTAENLSNSSELDGGL